MKTVNQSKNTNTNMCRLSKEEHEQLLANIVKSKQTTLSRRRSIRPVRKFFKTTKL